MLRWKVIFSKTEIFWPKKIYLRHLKGFQAYFMNDGYVLDIHIWYQLSKVNLAKLVAFLWFTSNFVKKLSKFWKNSSDLEKALNWYIMVFLRSTFTQKEIKTVNSFKNEKFSSHEFLWIRRQFFLSSEKRL